MADKRRRTRDEMDALAFAAELVASGDSPTHAMSCGDSCPVEFPEEPASDPDTADTAPPDTHTHTAGATDGGGETPVTFAGHASGEKREIYADLMAFIATHGLGARRRIAEASGGKLTVFDVQEMANCGKVTIQKWRAARAAMRRLEKAEKTSASE